MTETTIPDATPTPAGLWEHLCEHDGCQRWGAHGYQVAKQAPRWFCGEHLAAGERLLGR